MTRKYSSAPLGGGSILGTTTPAETPFPQNSEDGNDSFLRKMGASANSRASLTTVGAFAALFAANSAASTISFSQSNYNVSENSGYANIKVERTDCGFSDPQASVSYETSDASATSGTSGSDYNAVSGILYWGASGDCGPRSFDVAIFDDAESEGNETVELILKAPMGAGLGLDHAVLTIQNDDNAPPPLEQKPPVAQMSVNPNTGTAPVTVNLSSSSYDPDGNIEKCEWQVPGKPLMSGCNTSMTFDSAGTYNITLKVTDNDGLTATATDSVSVEAAAKIPPVAQMSVNPKTGTAPVTVNLSSSSYDPDGNIEKCEWQVPGKPSMSGCNTSMTFDSAGTYNITLKVTDDDGLTATAIDSVNVEAAAKIPPVAQMSVNPKTGTAPVTVNLSSSSYDSDGNIEKCEWQVPGKLSMSGCNTSMTFDSAGTYNITLQVTDNDGLTATTTDSVSVKAQQSPVANMSVNPTSGQAPLTVTANGNNSFDPDGSISSYKWTVSNGQSASGSQANFVFNQGGQYNIFLVVTDNDGLTSSTVQQMVSVTSKNTLPTAAFVATPTEGKSPLTVTLNGSQSSDSDGSIVHYAWTTSDGQITIGQSAQMTFVAPGTYTISLVVTDDKNDTSSNTAIQAVTVDKPEVRPIARLVALPMMGEAPLKVELDGGESYDPDGNVVSYEWTASDGQRADQQQTEMAFDTPGDYKITLVVTDNDGLQSTETWRTIKVTEGGGTPPVAKFEDLPASVSASSTVDLNASESYDPDGNIVSYEWMASNGQTTLSYSGSNASLNFEQIGNYTVMLTVTDDEDLKDTASQTITITAEEIDAVRVEVAGLNEYYAVGETVIVDLVEKVNTNRFNRVDLWVAIQIPSGDLLFFTPLPLAPYSPNPQAFRESLESASKTTRLLDFEVIKGIGGTYIFYALYVEEGKNPMNYLDDLGVVQRSNLAIQTTTLASE